MSGSDAAANRCAVLLLVRLLLLPLLRLLARTAAAAGTAAASQFGIGATSGAVLDVDESVLL